MSKRLFVGGLPYGISNTQLEEMFTQFGAVVSCNVITDKFTGRSKGFGFVEMENDEEADKAIQSLNGKDLEGRKIVVNVARPMEERPPRDFHSDRRGGGGGGFDRRPRRDSNQRRY